MQCATESRALCVVYIACKGWMPDTGSNGACLQVMLRYIDSGDDVGVALSPQLMYNVIPDCDVFNHQNVHFWEMMQPGMDALGFISLTGTNMIMRSRALREAGWFPMNSVTEDWALGMRFKKLGYRCRYVNVR
jgi:cellulose synthase/poly-beta-1,6-N-acetylglucosamine synthase-like glycosyltransferase